MLALAYLLLLSALAYPLRIRVPLLASFRGIPRYLCSLGLTLFVANWVNFLLFTLVGAGVLYLRISWAIPLLALLYFSEIWKPSQGDQSGQFWSSALARIQSFRDWNYWFLFLAGFVLVRYYVGIDTDDEGNVWSTFNFVDTAFHLSVVNSFLGASHFPPVDLDMAPFPLKYHFLADFHVAHLVRLGLQALDAMWLMNVISATIMVGTVWATFEHWLKLPARWVMLAGLIFLFLNTALLNVIHFLVLRPRFFDLERPFYGLLRFPYFNFESIQSSMLEPQRGLLFSLPVVLLILHALFGDHTGKGEPALTLSRTTLAFVLVCLLPLAHIVAFAVMAPCLLPALWRHRARFLARWWIWLPAFALGVAQLLYLEFYGPPTNAGFSSWSAVTSLPLQDFAAFPRYTRRIAFWFFANGDFLFWGLLFSGMALWRRGQHEPGPSSAEGLAPFVMRWRWYLAVCGFFFALINVYRYSFDWGDSNKFVLFLNLGLALVITLGAAQWVVGRFRFLSHLLWFFFLVLSAGPATYGFYDNVLASGHGDGTVLLFEKNGRHAAEWVKRTLPPTAIILTAANNTIHFVTPMTGHPTMAGIYGDSNPYRQDERTEQIRRIYEDGDFQLLRKLQIPYVCVSRNERRKYTLSDQWTRLMTSGTAVAFHAGEGPQDYHSVYIFDSRRLNSP